MVKVVNDALVRVTQLEQAEHMRQIRNSCRQFMTNHQGKISVEDQARWFQSIVGSETVLAFLYQPQGSPIGYGLLRLIDDPHRVHRDAARLLAAEGLVDRWWISGGLLPEHRGQGHGRVLFGALAALVEDFGETCWLTVFKNNTVARRTYEALGFVEEPQWAAREKLPDEGPFTTVTMKRVRP